MAGLIGKKIGMTSMFSDEGKNIPCTIIQAGPCTVTQIKTNATDGYDAVQISFDEQKDSRLSKAFISGSHAFHFNMNNTIKNVTIVHMNRPGSKLNHFSIHPPS